MQLYMTELGVLDWPRCVAWYCDVMGLPLLILDEARRFALLGGDGGRIALKEGPTSAGVRLAFEVTDIESARAALDGRGAAPSAIVQDADEGYRSFRVINPGGVTIEIFSWRQGS